MLKKLFIFFKKTFYLFVLFYISISIYIRISPKPIINTANGLVLYDNNNQVFFQGNESKEWINLDDISNYLINCTIYTEDKNFYKHNGFDFLRIIKAVYTNLRNQSTSQGASTITQQYAKNLFLDFDKTWKRKWDEMWYTMKIETHYTKKDILEGYLNTINYGHGKFGIENASKFYFNKSASDLTLAEASILSGIPKSPENYSPIKNFNASKKRQKLVLNSLVNNGIITEKEKNDALKEKLIFTAYDNKKEYSSVMFYHDAVIKELNSIKSIPKSFSENKGLRIYTSLDLDMQYNVEKNILNSIPDNSEIQTSVVMMNPKNGEIISLIGGKDYNHSTFNRAINSKRQVGSTMKPYLYYAALENGFTASSAFTSEATTFTFSSKDNYSPQNYNNKYGHKPISMAAAIAYSENIYAVKTHLFLGSDALIDVCRRIGIKASLEKIPSLPLGTNDINIIEMAQGYSTFANLGYKVTPHFINTITDLNGNILYKAKNNKELVLNSSMVFILNNMLTSTYDPLYIDYNYPTAINLHNKLKFKYALKSGTTNGDNWNIGYNNDIVTAVWVGYDDNRSLKPSEYKYSQSIWYKSSEYFCKNKNCKWYKKPSNISTVIVEPISGKPANDKDKNKKLMYFIKGTEPNAEDMTFDEINNRYIKT